MKVLLADSDLTNSQKDLLMAYSRQGHPFLTWLPGYPEVYGGLMGWLLVVHPSGSEVLEQLQACPQPAGAH